MSNKIVKDKVGVAFSGCGPYQEGMTFSVQVLALSLREALQVAAERVMKGNTSSGPDDTMGGSDPSDGEWEGP